MKNYAEIKAHIEVWRKSMFGFEIEALVEFLSFEEALSLGILKDDLPPETREKWDPHPRTKEAVQAAIHIYMLEYGFDKAINHRGISTTRTIDKMRALIWLLGDHDELIQFLAEEDHYSYYGVPMLKRIAAEFSIPIPPAIAAWVDGEPCSMDCEEGCNS